MKRRAMGLGSWPLADAPLSAGVNGFRTYSKDPIQTALSWTSHKGEVTAMPKVRVLIVDDNESVRNGIRMFLELHEGFTVCGEAADGLEGIKKAFELQPDVVLLDLSMPNLDGMEATHLIQQGCPLTEIVIVTNHMSLEAARLAAAHPHASRSWHRV